LSSQKRGGSRLYTSYTIVDVIKIHFKGFKLKNRLQRLGPKKGGDFFDVECALPKPQRRVKTLRYSLCDDIPTAANIAVSVTTGGVSLLICKNILFCFHTPPCAVYDHIGGRQFLSIDTTLDLPSFVAVQYLSRSSAIAVNPFWSELASLPSFGLDIYSLVFTYHWRLGVLTLQ
jgi:hypothetical protein